MWKFLYIRKGPVVLFKMNYWSRKTDQYASCERILKKCDKMLKLGKACFVRVQNLFPNTNSICIYVYSTYSIQKKNLIPYGMILPIQRVYTRSPTPSPSTRVWHKNEGKMPKIFLVGYFLIYTWFANRSNSSPPPNKQGLRQDSTAATIKSWEVTFNLSYPPF